MRTEVKTAAIMGIIVVSTIIALSVYFGSLDEQVAQSGEPQMNSVLSGIDKNNLKKAPKLDGIAGYINIEPEKLDKVIKDKVVLYDIWTYSCINCQRTLPYIAAWNDRYSDKGLVIIGIHSPEFEFEKDINNVELAVEKFGITYPVILDNDKKIWDAFENRYWPRKYIADFEGYIRYDHIGEGAYEETEMVIQELLKERAAQLGLNIEMVEQLVDIEEFEHGSRTPELYFGYDFAFGRNHLGNKEGFQPEQSIEYVIPQTLKDNYFYLGGTWKNLDDRMVLISEKGTIVLPYFAKQVNIVAAGESELQILLDGKPISEQDAGADVAKDGTVITSDSTLYNLVDAEDPARHTIQINVSKPGFEIYTFTFG